MTATVMPSVAREIGGYAWFGWVVAIYMIGAIVAAATAGVLSQRLGLRRALVLGAVVYSLGCAACAAAPQIALFLAGRLLQGVGGGWVAGLCYVAVTQLFPQALWARVLSAMAGVWGVATLLSPLVGGLFAEAGFWRGAFWLFALQGIGFVAASVALVPSGRGEAGDGPTWRLAGPLAVLTLAVIAIGAAGLTPEVGLAAILGVAGCALLALFLRLNAGAGAALLPRSAADPRSGPGAGLWTIFALQAGTVSFTVYGPALLQVLHGASPVVAGYVICCEALAWTVAALAVASSRRDAGWIRLGASMILVATILIAFAVPRGTLAQVAALASLQGAGFGFLWAFTSNRIVANAPETERPLASASVPTTQMIGTAVGAAAAGAVGNLAGFGGGFTATHAFASGVWLFAALVPLAGLGVAAAWRLASPRFAPA
jgi:MFS family permease